MWTPSSPRRCCSRTGYLTITDVEDQGGRPLYRLGYPNREVRESLNECLLRAMVPASSRRVASSLRLREVLSARTTSRGLEALLRRLFASIPYEWHTKNEIARYEGYYASVFYSWFAGRRVGHLRGRQHESRSGGHGGALQRLRVPREFKVVESAPGGAAMEQLETMHYADKYRGSAQPVWLIAVEFSRTARNLAAFEVARADARPSG